MTTYFRDYEEFVLSKAEGSLHCYLLGLVGEVGEICDSIKKTEYHKREGFDGAHLQEELGDALFYLTAVVLSSGFTLQDVVAFNVAKLEKRYPDGFVHGGGNR